MRSLVLCSGGLDSAVCLAIAAGVTSAHEGETHTLTFDYGQSHSHEIESAINLSLHYKVKKHHIISLHGMLAGGGSALVDKGVEQPTGSYQELERNEKGMSPTYVPFRNGTFLSIGAAIAIVQECDIIWFGTHADDAGHWAYPDCTPVFMETMSRAIFKGSYEKVTLMTPLEDNLKKDIVRRGVDLGVPFELTRSCYSADPVSCGRCPTCIERLEAFRANGITDPIEYQKE